MSVLRTLCLFLLFGFGVSVLTAQEPLPASLRVTVDPIATLSLNHSPVKAGENFSLTLPPDEPAVLRLSAPGFRTQYRTVLLGPGERRHEAFHLVREAIPVLFRTNIPATVLCDGAELGTTPFHYFFSDPRGYRIVLRAPGCQDQAISLNLSDGKPRVIDAKLLSDSGTLTIETEPSGAHVFVNGIKRGVTPCDLKRIREGRHTFSIRLEGYKAVTHTLEVAAGETVPLSFRLERLPAGLTVSTLPDGARVYVDGVFRGESDITLTGLSEGQHTLRIEKGGYAEVSRSVTLAGGATQVEEFRLEVVRGTLAVQTQPAVVSVWESARCLLVTKPEMKDAFTSARTMFSLSPGTYTLTLKAEGYEDATKTVTISANKTEELRVRLAFKPNFEVQTRTGTYRGVLARQGTDGSISVEIKPGSYRTFTSAEILRRRFLED